MYYNPYEQSWSAFCSVPLVNLFTGLFSQSAPMLRKVWEVTDFTQIFFTYSL